MLAVGCRRCSHRFFHCKEVVSSRVFPEFPYPILHGHLISNSTYPPALAIPRPASRLQTIHHGDDNILPCPLADTRGCVYSHNSRNLFHVILLDELDIEFCIPSNFRNNCQNGPCSVPSCVGQAGDGPVRPGRMVARHQGSSGQGTVLLICFYFST